MSLINQALRKAQQQRSGTLPPGSDGPAPTMGMPAQEKRVPTGLIIGISAAFALLIGLVLGLSILLLRDKPEQQSQAPTEPVAEQPQTADAPPPSPSVQQTAATPQETLPEQEAETSAPAENLRQAYASASQTTQESGPSSDVLNELRTAREEIEEQLKEPVRSPQSIVEWLTKSRISAVRISPNGNKVIMNGNAYSVGEFANYTLRIKVLLIEKSRVLFEDENGKKYMKKIKN